MVGAFVALHDCSGDPIHLSVCDVFLDPLRVGRSRRGGALQKVVRQDPTVERLGLMRLVNCNTACTLDLLIHTHNISARKSKSTKNA